MGKPKNLYRYDRPAVVALVREFYPHHAVKVTRQMLIDKLGVSLDESTIRRIAKTIGVTLLPETKSRIIREGIALTKLKKWQRKQSENDDNYDDDYWKNREYIGIREPDLLSKIEILALCRPIAHEVPKRENYIDTWPN